MEVLFNEELFDKLSTKQIENLVHRADDIALNKMALFRKLVQRFRSENAGLELDEKLPRKRITPLKNRKDLQKVPETSLLNEAYFDSLSSEDIYILIKNSNPKTRKKIKYLGGFAEEEINERKDEDYLKTRNYRCNNLDKFRGNWIDELTCGNFENYRGYIVFRPNLGLLLYHASADWSTGDPRDSPLWLGSYWNSSQYIKEISAGDGYMNVFRIKRSPRLIILNEPSNIQKILRIASPEKQKSISTVTGIGNTNLEEDYRSYGCVYKNKDAEVFSRFSSREEDAEMATVVCSIPGIDGYIIPEVNYCSSGVAYRKGEPLPKAKRMYGEVMMCEGSKFLERVVDPALECEPGEDCDLSKEFWKLEF